MRKYITTDPDILGGTPVIKGTRIPVERVAFLLKDGFTLSGIHKLYPHVNVETLRGVLDDVFMQLNIKQHASIS